MQTLINNSDLLNKYTPSTVNQDDYSELINKLEKSILEYTEIERKRQARTAETSRKLMLA